MSATGAASATAVLWRRRDRRVPAIAAAAALTGAPGLMLRGASKVSFAASVECEAVLGEMHERIRFLPMALSSELERCVHSVRGPVMWSETITARANALGDEDVFVCSTVRRDFDNPENRLLVWLLAEAASASKAVRGEVGDVMAPGDSRRIEEIAMTARRWRHSPRLAKVAPHRPNVREISRMRSGRHGEQVEPLLVARRRLLQPFGSLDIEDLTDPRTAVLHIGVLEVFETVSSALGIEMVVGFSNGALRCGPVAFRHPEALGSAPAGLTIGGELVLDIDDVVDRARLLFSP